MTAGSDVSRTVTRSEGRGRSAALGVVEPARLIVALDCERPTTPALRVALAGTTEVVIGRGGVRGWRREPGRLELTIADQEMSRQHARLRRTSTGWELADLDSKNGTIVNGELIDRVRVLADGDLIEVGATVLMFREDEATTAITDRDLAVETGAPAAFRSIAPAVERLTAALAKIAPTPVPVLVCGETGTGKELIARAIHERSGRRGPFVAVNCGALPRTLIESELFGYRRGAFSEAREDRDGLVRRADGGTLFLDEIAELPEASQVALLRVLQEGEVRPLGASDAVTVDVRVVAATHQDLAIRIADGRFREDLYARLAGFAVSLPPLRERREDIGTLIAALLPRLDGVVASPGRVTFHRQTARALLGYLYPLNVRELEQALRTAAVLADGKEIRLEHLPDAIRTYAPTMQAALRIDDQDLRDRLVAVLREHGGNVAAAGRALGKAPIQIRRWCRRFELDLTTFR